MKSDRDSPDPAYAAARLRWRLYGTPVPARLWLQHRPVWDPATVFPELSSAKRRTMRQWQWERLAREAYRGYFLPGRTQIIVRARLCEHGDPCADNGNGVPRSRIFSNFRMANILSDLH